MCEFSPALAWCALGFPGLAFKKAENKAVCMESHSVWQGLVVSVTGQRQGLRGEDHATHHLSQACECLAVRAISVRNHASWR